MGTVEMKGAFARAQSTFGNGGGDVHEVICKFIGFSV